MLHLPWGCGRTPQEAARETSQLEAAAGAAGSSLSQTISQLSGLEAAGAAHGGRDASRSSGQSEKDTVHFGAHLRLARNMWALLPLDL